MTAPQRPIVLSLLGSLWPGNDSSGANLSFIGVAKALSDEFEFRYISEVRPRGSSKPPVANDRWYDLGYAQAHYCKPTALGADGLRNLLQTTPYKIILLNSFYDRQFTLPYLAMRRAGLVPRRPALLAPRGEFGTGAMAIKPRKKAAWRAFARASGLLSDVWIHATSPDELRDIKQGFPWAKGYFVASTVTPLPDALPFRPSLTGVLRLTLLARISKVKNVDYAIKALAAVRSRVALTLFGPLEDLAYWHECQDLIATLPSNVTVRHAGEIANSDVPVIMAETDLFFLPTAGENFGHAIFEALGCGVPILISDQTPWRGLKEVSAGWDLPLARPEDFARTVELFAAMDATDRSRLRLGARKLAETYVRESDAVSESRNLLRQALASASDRQDS